VRHIEAEYNAAVDEISRLYQKVAETKVVTLAGLECKARPSLRDECDDGFGIRLAEDPLAIKAA
jgi:hypothetical protein